MKTGFCVLALLMLATPVAAQSLGCWYGDKRDDGEFARADDCGVVVGDSLKLSPQLQQFLAFADDGSPSCVWGDEQQMFYVRSDGSSRRVLFFDNGCDYFEAGLARGYEDGKLVYINPQLQVSIRPGFSYLEAFYYDHARVCNDVVFADDDDEHQRVAGGRCGLINLQGQLVLPAIYALDDWQSFKTYLDSHNECAPPPITTSSAALCHAQRHLRYSDFYQAKAGSLLATAQPPLWLVTFENEDGSAARITLDAQSASYQVIEVLDQ